MNARSLKLVFAFVVAIGILGLVFRLISGVSESDTLSGLFPLNDAIVSEIIVSSYNNESRLIKSGGTWRVGINPVYDVRMQSLWSVVDSLDDAHLVAINEQSQDILGVDLKNGIEVDFRSEGKSLESIIIGKWIPDTGLSYLRRPGYDATYSLPFDIGQIFNPNPDSWRDPIIINIIESEIESILVTGNNRNYNLRKLNEEWFVFTDGKQYSSNKMSISQMMQLLNPLIAEKFASEQEMKLLDFESADINFEITFQGTGDREILLFILTEDQVFLKVDGKRTVYSVLNSLSTLLTPKLNEIIID